MAIAAGQSLEAKRSTANQGLTGLSQLKSYKVSQATLRTARAKALKTPAEWELARESWSKTCKDIQHGFAGEPIPLSSLDLQDNLLVGTFGIYERRAGQNWKVSLINNFRSNTVNNVAWLPSAMTYDSFDELQRAARVLKERWIGDLHLGKADFKSAFKTLPPAREQRWLCWSLVLTQKMLSIRWSLSSLRHVAACAQS